MPADADVLIVGGGPAGSTAALLLARAGVRVRILERATFPRDKLCGDTLNPGTLALLDGMGIEEDVRERALAVKGMVVTGPGDARVVGDYGTGVRGAAMTRRELDALLLEAAVKAGAVVEERVDVQAPLVAESRVIGLRTAELDGGRDRRAPLVIATDGRHSRVAFGLGLSHFAARPKRWAFGAYFAGVDALTEYGEMHVRGRGYIGIAPVPGGIANVCVVKEWRRDGQDVRGPDVIAETVASEPDLRGRFRHAERVSPMTVLGPLAVESTGAGMSGLLLAGDAAGFIDPMTGDGLRFAIRGAQLAAEAALRELEDGAPACHDLFQARRQEFSAKWRVNRALRALVGSPRGVRFASIIASNWSAPVEALIAFAGDVPAATRAR